MSRAGLVLSLYGGLALVAVAVAALRGDLNIYVLEGVTTSPLRLVASVLLGVGVGLVFVFLSRLAVHRFAWARDLHRDFRGILGELSHREILVIAVASSIGEELLFRGALLPWIGVWPQAVIFALLHVGPGLRFLPWTLSSFALGALFGYVFLWTGDLGGPIAAHFVINYLNLNFIARVALPERELEAAEALARRRPGTARPGSKSGARADSHADARADSHAGARADSHAGARADSHSGARAESHGGERAESHGGGGPDGQAGEQNEPEGPPRQAPPGSGRNE